MFTVSLPNFIVRGDLRSYYRRRLEAGHRAGQEFLQRNKGADRAWLGGFLQVGPAAAVPPLNEWPVLSGAAADCDGRVLSQSTCIVEPRAVVWWRVLSMQAAAAYRAFSMAA